MGKYRIIREYYLRSAHMADLNKPMTIDDAYTLKGKIEGELVRFFPTSPRTIIEIKTDKKVEGLEIEV